MMNATTTTTNSDDDDDDTTATAAAPDAEEQQQKHYTSSYSFGLSWQGERKSEKSAHANADNSILISLCLLSFLSGSVSHVYTSSNM
jgi:hypothetical protein